MHKILQATLILHTIHDANKAWHGMTRRSPAWRGSRDARAHADFDAGPHLELPAAPIHSLGLSAIPQPSGSQQVAAYEDRLMMAAPLKHRLATSCAWVVMRRLSTG